MANFNRFIGIGNLTRDPEIRAAGNGTVSKLGVAINNPRKDKTTQQWIDDPVFLDCEIWDTDMRKHSEFIRERCSKGTSVFIEGRLKQDNWTDPQGGKRSKILCVIDKIQLVGKPEKAEPAQTQQQPRREEHATPIREADIPFAWLMPWIATAMTAASTIY